MTRNIAEPRVAAIRLMRGILYARWRMVGQPEVNLVPVWSSFDLVRLLGAEISRLITST